MGKFPHRTTNPQAGRRSVRVTGRRTRSGLGHPTAEPLGPDIIGDYKNAESKTSQHLRLGPPTFRFARKPLPSIRTRQRTKLMWE